MDVGYLKERQIPDILKAVVHRLSTAKPECPIRFMIEHLRTCYLPAETERYHAERFYGVKLLDPIHYGGMQEEEQEDADPDLLVRKKRDRDDVDNDLDGLDVIGVTSGEEMIVEDRAQKEGEPTKMRRGGFCDTPMNGTMDIDFTKFPPKPPHVVAALEKASQRNRLFSSLDSDERELIFRAMFECSYEAGDTIICEGDQGDNYYILTQGQCEAFVSTSPDNRPVFHYSAGDSFGELALIHGTPRKATVVAVTNCVLWGLERTAYRQTLMKITCEKRTKFGEFLSRVPLLSSLNKYDRMVIADCLEVREYSDGDIILRQGDMGESFFFVCTGSVKIVQRVGSSEGTVGLLGPGDYFGEIALLTTRPRQATCLAVGPTKCASMRREDFVRLLGPVQDKVMEKIPLYKKYLPESEGVDQRGL